MANSPSTLEIQDAQTQHRTSIAFYAIVIWIVAICTGLSSLYCWTTLLLQPLEISSESPAWTQNVPPIPQIVLAMLVSEPFIHMVDFKPHESPSFLLYLVPVACLFSTGQTVFLVFNLIIAPTGQIQRRAFGGLITSGNNGDSAADWCCDEGHRYRLDRTTGLDMLKKRYEGCKQLVFGCGIRL